MQAWNFTGPDYSKKPGPLAAHAFSAATLETVDSSTDRKGGTIKIMTL
jgi:hypothetical protein